MDTMGNRVNNMEEAIKKLADQNCSILKIVVDNMKTLLDKLDQGEFMGLRMRLRIKAQINELEIIQRKQRL